MESIQIDKKDKRGRGQPRGFIQYQEVYDSIKLHLSEDPQTASQIQKEVMKELTATRGPDYRGASRETIRKYLNRMAEEGIIIAKPVGTSSQLTVYFNKVEKNVQLPEST